MIREGKNVPEGVDYTTMKEPFPEEEVIELNDFTLIIHGQPSSEACQNFVKIIQQMKVSQQETLL